MYNASIFDTRTPCDSGGLSYTSLQHTDIDTFALSVVEEALYTRL